MIEFIFSLFDECMLRAFFLAFNMKNLGNFKVLKEFSIYLNSSSQYCGLNILRTRK